VLGSSAGLDLPAMGCNPLRKNVLLEHDWFDDALECGAHSHRPTAAALALATTAFANAPIANPDGSLGITLIHDYGQGGVFTGGNRVADADGVLVGNVFAQEFQGYKSAHFAANRSGFFHYVLHPHRYDTNSGSSGYAEIVGDDLIVSLYCLNGDVNVGNTLMHELGHNLGLRHGGNEDVNYKPNYNSVMNYLYQFPGVDTDCTPPGNGRLDFSRNQRITLNESSLLEPLGICGAGNPPWDWNANGVIDSAAVQADINSDFQQTSFADYDDWANVMLNWRGTLAAQQVSLATKLALRCDNAPLVRR
jgi:hypothetical protein